MSILIHNILRLPGNCLFEQPDLFQGASSKNRYFRSNFEDRCLLGSQWGEQSKSLQVEDGKLCHWKRKAPISEVGCSQHHNLRALLRLHWSPWPPEDQKILKRNLVYLAELAPSYITWLRHQERHQYVVYFPFISKWAEVTPHSPSIFWDVGLWHSLSPCLAQGPCSVAWWRKLLRLGGWARPAHEVCESVNTECFLCLTPELIGWWQGDLGYHNYVTLWSSGNKYQCLGLLQLTCSCAWMGPLSIRILVMESIMTSVY